MTAVSESRSQKKQRAKGEEPKDTIPKQFAKRFNGVTARTSSCRTTI